MHYISKKLFSKIYKEYGIKYYPKKFKKKFRFDKKFTLFKKNLNKNKSNQIIELATQKVKVNPNDIWNKRKFTDREDVSSLHRWSWALKLISTKKNNLSISEKKFVEDCINNWCVYYNHKKIEKENIIFEPYNISERICNYLILIKLKILRPNNFVLYNLEKQFTFLLENIEYYKFRLSNHALNNLRAIYLFSVYTKNERIINYSLKFIDFLLYRYLDQNSFFKFGSSNYQFIFSKWLLDILLFSKSGDKKKYLKIKNRLKKIFSTLSFFVETDKYKNKTIPLFGNVSPDFDNNWIINFFFKNKSNYFFKKYWKNIDIRIIQKKIKSKEWLKLNNKKFTIFLRNPKLIGFDFNHSHNDFFNFILFYKGKKIILDPGRENYSFDSLKRDISGKSHNSISINNTAIYDEYLIYNLLYKLGFKNVEKCQYSISTNYKNYIKLTSLEKKFTIIRKIYLKDNYVSIIDNIVTKKRSDVKLKLNLNMTRSDYKKNNQLKIFHDSKINNSNKIVKKKFYKSYGSSFEGSSLIVNFFNTNKIESCFKIKG